MWESGGAEGDGTFAGTPGSLRSHNSRFPGGCRGPKWEGGSVEGYGPLAEALDAYEATIRDFPGDAVARTGKATLLVLLGRYEEAAALVRTDRTQTRDEWVALHIRASIKLKQNSLDEADRLLSTGTPLPLGRRAEPVHRRGRCVADNEEATQGGRLRQMR